MIPLDVEMMATPRPPKTRGSSALFAYMRRPGLEIRLIPEIEYDKIDKVRGMDIIFVTTAQTDEEARYLLTLFNMPFAK